MKKLLIALLVLVVLVIGGLLAAPFLIPVDTYKRQVAAQVEAATGRQLAIDGPVDLQLLPSVALEADTVRLSNVEGASESDMLRLDAIEVELKILPLFSGSVEVDRFVLIEPEIHLEIDEEGVPNWQFGKPGSGAPDEGQPKDDAPAPEQGGGGLPVSELKLGDIRIENGTLTFRDRTTGTNERIKNINLSVDLPDLKSPLQAEGSLDYKGKTVEIGLGLEQPLAIIEGGASKLNASIDAEPVAFTFDGEAKSGAAPGARGALDLDVRAIRGLASWLSQPLTMPGDGFRSLSIAGELDATPDRVAFSDAAIVFDDIKAEGEVSAVLSGARPVVRGRLDVGEVDLAPYMPEPAEGGDAREESAGDGDGNRQDEPAKGWSNEPIPIPKLDMVDLEFDLGLDKLLVDDLQLDRTELAIALQDAVLNLDLTEFQLYGGGGQGQFKLDMAASDPAIDAAFRLDGLQALPFLTAAAGFERIEGLANASFDVSTQGRSQRDLVRALNGEGEVRFEDGAVVGINLAQMVRNIGAAFSGGGEDTQKTDFAALGGSFRIKNGVLRNDDLELKAPVLRLAGSGEVNLKRRTIDYRVEPKAAATLEGQGGQDEVAGILVPVDITGSFNDPKFAPDLAAALGNAGAAGEAVQQQLDQLDGQKDDIERAAKRAQRKLKKAAESGDVESLVEGASGLLGGNNNAKNGGGGKQKDDDPTGAAQDLLRGILKN